MTRWATVVLVGLGLLAGVVAPAVAEHGHKSALQIFAENPKARFNPKVQLLLIEERLRRPEPIELYPLYLTPHDNGAALDLKIRRLGELIRRQELESR